MFNIVTVLVTCMGIGYFVLKAIRNIHMLQLNSYMNNRFFTWVKNNLRRQLSWRELVILILLFIPVNQITLVIWFGVFLGLIVTNKEQKEKKKFIYTTRVKRLLFTTFLFILSIGFIPFFFNHNSLGLILMSLSILFNPLVIILSNTANKPMEYVVNNFYVSKARQKIAQYKNLTVIGITGSYGKTSTKFITNQVLSEQFNVLMTPESYNTLMGVTLTIRNFLKPIHNIFIAEMGAKSCGDIKEICDLAKPKIGIITSIGEQHLETFKKIENIRRAKCEILDDLPKNGLAILNKDDHYLSKLKLDVRTIFFGIDQSEGLHYVAENIKINSGGLSFSVRKYDGTGELFQTKLLGKHNIYNILAAVAVASEMGMDLKTISQTIKKISPVPHRLELKSSPNGLTIIDDAFNSNPVGARMALDVLGEMNCSKRILITPGMVELGPKEQELNYEFGRYAASKSDYIILVGPKRTLPIQQGLTEAGFPQEKLYIASDLSDALNHLAKVSSPDCIVLIENDLPDNYNE